MAEQAAREEAQRVKKAKRDKRKAEIEARRLRNMPKKKKKGRKHTLFKSVKLSETIFDNGRKDTEAAIERFFARLFAASLIR